MSPVRPSEHEGRIAQWVEVRLGGLALTAHRRPALAISVIAIVLILAAFSARRLDFDADLVELLPKSFRSVKDIDLLKERFGGIGYVVVVGMDAEPDALRRFAEDVVPRLDELPAVRYVDYRRPLEFFADRALYFFDLADLKTVKKRLGDREQWERRKHNPMYIDMEDSQPPQLDFSDLEEKYSGRSERKWMEAQLGETYYLDEERKIIALLVKPASMASDLDFSREVVGQVQGFVDRLNLSKYGPDMRVELTGRYKKRIDMQSMISKDLALASAVALVLMLLYIGIHFRRATAVALITIPLVVGLTWTFGFAGCVFESLNILTGFIGAILLGLGVDHGIHLLGRYEAERKEDRTHEEAIRRAFGNTGRAVTIAALTTTVAFAGLGLSEFRAFREFGIIAAVGMISVVAAYSICLPAFLGVADRLGWRPSTGNLRKSSKYAGLLPRWAPAIFWLFLLGIFGSAVYIPSAGFDYNFSSLEATDLSSFRLDLEVNRLLGYSQTPVVLLAADEDEERAVASAIRKRRDAAGEESTVDFIAAGADLIPLAQDEKHLVIKDIGRIIRKIKPKWLDPEDRGRLRDLKRMTSIEPFDQKDLPVEVRRMFAGPDASIQEGFVLVFPGISLSDGLLVREFAREVREIPLPDGRTVSAAGEAMILADILEMVFREAPPVLAMTLVLVFVALWLMLGRLRNAFLCLVPAACTLTLLVGLLPLSELRLNYLNIIMIPVLFGISVDGAVHLVTRLSGDHGLTDVVNETGRSIAGAILTTGMGFGSLLLADHQGLNSLGKLAMLGLSANLVACLVGLPALLALLATRRKRAGKGAGSGGRGGRIVEDLATVGMAGESPVAPGTLGALAAIPVGWFLSGVPGPGQLAILVAITLVSVAVVNRFISGRSDTDPPEVVLDEFIGCLIALAFVPWEAAWVIAAFVLFRLLDIWKPWPIRVVDRRIHGGIGVIGDDVIAGLLAGVILLALHSLGCAHGFWT